jgi:hypothetical protein
VDDEGDTGFNPSLALDSLGLPHISYHDERDAQNGDTRDLNYAYYDGSSWHIAVIDGEDNTGGSNSLELDSLDRPHIAYDSVIPGNDKNLKYAWYDGSAWNIEIVEAGGYLGGSCSLALDSFELPHIVYIDRSTLYDKVKYASFDGAAWQIETVRDEAGAGYGENELVLDSQGFPRFSSDYSQGGVTSDIAYFSYDGLGWDYEVLDFADRVGSPSLALDSADNPCIALRDKDTRFLLYTRWNGSTWITKPVDYLGENPSLVIDAQDKPRISYYKDGVLFYAAYY